MKKFIKFTLVFFLVNLVLTTNLPILVLAQNIQTNINSKSTSDNKNGEVIIMYNQNATDFGIQSKGSVNSKSFLNGLTVKKSITFEDNQNNNLGIMSSDSSRINNNTQFVVSLVKSNKYTTNELINKLSKENSIMYVQKNYKVKAASITNDTYQKYQWAIENIGQNKGKKGLDINPETVQNQSSEEKVIAIVDSGVDYNHSELKKHMWNNPYLKKGKLLGKHGYDFANGDADPMDDNGHGTHVAGIIAGESNNNEGITGAILNKSNIKIMPLKFLDEQGYGSSFSVIEAYHYIYKAQKLGTNIVAVNNSWGGISDGSDDILKSIIDLIGKGPKSDGKGALSICAAGNESINTDSIFNSPSCIKSDYIISVAATNENDSLATFSNYGINTVDIAAPGADILSTVSYNCFNPSIYENKANLCDRYDNFDSGLGNFKYKVSNGKVSATSNVYFGNSGKSLKWNFDSVKGKEYYLLIPFEVKKSNQHISEMIRVIADKDKAYECYIECVETNYEDINSSLNTSKTKQSRNLNKYILQKENYWNHYEGIAEKSGTLMFIYRAGENSKVSIYIDDFAISKSNINGTQYGKYDFYSGTSMATPFVSAAVAIASNYNGNETAINRKSRVLGATRKVESLNNKVSTGGVLDLTYLKNPNLIIKSATINLEGELSIGVTNMKKTPKVFINNKEMKATKVNSSTLKVVNKSLLNRTAKITLKCDQNNIASRTVYLSAGKRFNGEGTVYDIEEMNKVFTNGKNIYTYSNNLKTVYKIEKEGTFSDIVVAMSNNSIKQLLGEQSNFMDSEFGANYNLESTDFVFVNNRIYTIFTFDFGYTKERVLAYYDINKNDQIWRKSTLPSACKNLVMPTLASYNSNLYVIGGYNDVNNKITKKVYQLNMNTKKWSTLPDLPEGRFAAKATQVGDKLLLTFGGKEDGTIPNILIYNGSKWKKTTSNIELKGYTGIYKNKKYYKLGTGIVSGGLIFSGLNAERLGNTFYYDIAKDKYKSSGYKVNVKMFSDSISIGNKYYAFEQYNNEDEYESEVRMYSIPVKTGFSKLTVTYPETGIKASINEVLYNRKKVDNKLVNTYYYMPGRTMTFNLSDIAGRYIKNFKVDGKEINGYKYSNAIGKDRTIQITTATTTSLIKLNKTSSNINSFSTLKLKTTLGDKKATAVKWTSNNNKYATVSSAGVVTPKWAGNGKTVTITASSSIRGRKVSVVSKINIKLPTINNFKVSQISKDRAILSWGKVNGADRYEIYMFNNKTKQYALYKTQKTNIIEIPRLKAGITYRFQVSAYKIKDKNEYHTPRAMILFTTPKK